MPKKKTTSQADVKPKQEEQEFQIPSELIPEKPEDVIVGHNQFLWEICFPFISNAPSFGFQPYEDNESCDRVIDFAKTLGVPLQGDVELKTPITFWAAREVAIAWLDAREHVDQCDQCHEVRYLRKFKIEGTGEENVGLCRTCQEESKEILIPWSPKTTRIEGGK